MYRNDIHSVEVNRVHKSSPYNCSGYIPEIGCSDREKVIDLPEVQALINNTYGKHFIVNIHTQNETDFLQYDIVKPKAIVK